MNEDLKFQNELNEFTQIITELFNPNIQQQRKEQIENMLFEYQSQQQNLLYLIHFLSYSDNKYILWYSCTEFEKIIKHKWNLVSNDQQKELTQFLMDFLTTRNSKFSAFERNKIIKVIVEIAKKNWPNYFPDLFPFIENLINMIETTKLGLSILKIIIEEFISGKNDIPSQRRGELKQNLSEQIPNILLMLQNTLEKALESQKDFSSRNISQINSIYSSPPIFQFKRNQQNQKLNYNSSINPDLEQIISSVFECLLEIFTWIDLNKLLSNSFISLIAKFVPITKTQTIEISSGIQALSCFIEILSRNYVPLNSTDFITIIFDLLVSLIRKWQETPEIILDLSVLYMSKYLHLFELFMSRYFTLLESNQFSLEELFSLLFKFQRIFLSSYDSHSILDNKEDLVEGNVTLFMNCIDIWNIFVESIETSQDTNIMEKYSSGILVVFKEMIELIFFSQNSQKLSLLDTEIKDENGQTELDGFISKIKELLIRIAWIFPEQAIETISGYFGSQTANFFQVNQVIGNNQIPGEEDARLIQYLLLDLKIICRMFGEMGEYFVNGFEQKLEFASNIVNNFCDIAIYSNEYQLFLLNQEFSSVYSQAILSLSGFSKWIYLLNEMAVEGQNPDITNDVIEALFNKIMEFMIPVFINNQQMTSFDPNFIANNTQNINNSANSDSQQIDVNNSIYPNEILHSACVLLNSLSLSVRTQELLSLPQVAFLFANAYKISQNFSLKNQSIFYSALSRLLIFPFNKLLDSQQEWEGRREKFIEFSQDLTLNIEEFSTLTPPEAAAPEMQSKIIRTYKIINSLVKSLEEGNIKSREIFTSIFGRNVLDVCFDLLQVCPESGSIQIIILKTYYHYFHHLKTQIGVDYVQERIKAALFIYSQNSLFFKYLDRKTFVLLIKILQNTLNETTRVSHYENLIPDIIKFLIEDLLPHTITQSNDNAYIRLQLFELIYTLLLQRWNYFINLNQNLQSNLTIKINNILMSPNDQFIGLINIILDCCANCNDINLYKLNLDGLLELEKIRQLFKNSIFLNQFAVDFLNTFLRVLIEKTQQSLRNEIIQVIWSISSSDINGFYNKFLVEFLENSQEIEIEDKNILINQFKQETDLPTFTLQINQFIHDYCFFRELKKN
ncbi:exportin-6 [Anaeramoeba ignava]|uniref:Exportin-6 n=1 Tax=Anaeramoeba ignava TaxID=1746090 RepID=A0A9Q0LS36_ANAIG|nr:exportin-6 [Anaeramoeba ignava]